MQSESNHPRAYQMFITSSFPFRRYHDKERSSTPETVVTSPPTFKVDDIKKPISVKTTVKPLSAKSATQPPKKINMGAALNYGKASDLGINSPTHRNSHNEDLFGEAPVVSKTTTKSSNDIIEDIFSSSTADPLDDFDPRAEEASADFGDFSSAFGSGSAAPPKAAAPAVATEFADFSSAFSAQSSAPPLVDNFLFNAQPAPPSPLASSLLGSADLFGNSVITSAFTSPPVGGSKKDLLSDFGDLTLNPIQGKRKAANYNFKVFPSSHSSDQSACNFKLKFY